MALIMSTEKQSTIVRLSVKNTKAECPLRPPARRVKKSLLSIYLTIMMDVFSHSCWNGC